MNDGFTAHFDQQGCFMGRSRYYHDKDDRSRGKREFTARDGTHLGHREYDLEKGQMRDYNSNGFLLSSKRMQKKTSK